MNEDTAFRRVRIGKVLLPLLEDLNPQHHPDSGRPTATTERQS